MKITQEMVERAAQALWDYDEVEDERLMAGRVIGSWEEAESFQRDAYRGRARVALGVLNTPSTQPVVVTPGQMTVEEVIAEIESEVQQ